MLLKGSQNRRFIFKVNPFTVGLICRKKWLLLVLHSDVLVCSKKKVSEMQSNLLKEIERIKKSEIAKREKACNHLVNVAEYLFWHEASL